MSLIDLPLTRPALEALLAIARPKGSNADTHVGALRQRVRLVRFWPWIPEGRPKPRPSVSQKGHVTGRTFTAKEMDLCACCS